MTSILREFRPAIVMVLALSLILGLAYPLAVTGVAQFVFPDKAGGSLIHDSRNIVGSRLIGQSFTDPKYFWPRPSAAGANGYDASSSGGSNLGPTSQLLRDQVTQRAAALRQAHGLATDADVPAELVTASASGLDPDISPDSAKFQAQRVAAARRLPLQQVLDLIDQHTNGRTLGVLGQPRVNVLELNMALDGMKD